MGGPSRESIARGCIRAYARARTYIDEINARTVCAHCGAQPIEWHNPEHVEPGLGKNRIAMMPQRHAAIATIAAEMARCIPLCRRCHMVEDGRLGKFVVAKKEPSPCLECSRLYKPLRRGLCGSCYKRKRRAAKRIPCCSNCGMRHDPNDKASCIEGHGDDPIQVTIHGTYGQGPMPVEFRDALVEMVRLVKQGIEDGTLGKRRQPQQPGGER